MNIPKQETIDKNESTDFNSEIKTNYYLTKDELTKSTYS
jgi:hypothetical protein